MSLLHKKQIFLTVTDTNISAQDISHADGKIISEHSVPVPSGVIVRGDILDESRFSEALQSLNTASGHAIHDLVLKIPSEQCFESVCIVPIDLPKENIRASVIAHARTIIPIHHDRMYIGHALPKVVANTNTQSVEYLAVEGDVFDVYRKVFEKNKIELEGVQGTGSAPGSVIFIPLSQFEQVGGDTPLKKKLSVGLPTLVSPESAVQKKRIATYIFLATTLIVLGYIIYTYIIVPFL